MFRPQCVNSLVPRGIWMKFWVILNHILIIDCWGNVLSNCHQVIVAGSQSILVQVMAWCHQSISHYLSQCWPRSMFPCGVTLPQWVNSLWRSDAIWWQRSGSTLAQVMACCVTDTKPLPEPMLTYHQWSPVTFILGQFQKRCLNHQSLKSVWKLHV